MYLNVFAVSFRKNENEALQKKGPMKGPFFYFSVGAFFGNA
jgi:hypothetical protein